MRDVLQPDDIGKRRDLYIDRFCKDLMNALFYPKSSQDVITWIDNIFTKLKRLLRNQSKIQNNDEFQKNFFVDTCQFLNALNWNFHVRKFHNSISKTSLDEYKNMTLWEQFYNNAYEEHREFDYDCKWWSCTNRTISLYKFFDALREAGLDIKISIYRLKNNDDNFVGVASMRHSWLVINFRGVDYMVDYEWINDIFSGCLIQSINSLEKEIRRFWIKDTKNLDALKFENWKKYTSRKDKNILIHFDNTESFLKDIEEYPRLKKISFITHELNNWEPTRLDYEFFNWWVYVEVNDYQRVFILKKDAVLKKDKKEFLKSLVDNVESVRSEYWERKVKNPDKEELSKLLKMIENDINLDTVVSEYE